MQRIKVFLPRKFLYSETFGFTKQHFLGIMDIFTEGFGTFFKTVKDLVNLAYYSKAKSVKVCVSFSGTHCTIWQNCFSLVCFRAGILTQLVPTLQGILERIRWAYPTISCLILHRWAPYVLCTSTQMSKFLMWNSSCSVFILFYSANQFLYVLSWA
jgi:hypothetical protein